MATVGVELPPHPVRLSVEDANTTRGTSSSKRLRERHPERTQSRPARLAKPVCFSNGIKGVLFEDRAVVVPMTSDTEPVLPGERVTLVGLMTQVASAGAPEQASFTVPLNVALAERVSVATPF